MRARSLNKKIEIWSSSVSFTDDGFGGKIPVDGLVSKSWAKIETAKTSASKLNDIGLNDLSFNILVTLRKRSDLTYDSINQYIKYRGNKYLYVVAPTETNFNDSFITLIATKQKTD